MNWKRTLWVLWTGCILSSASYTMVVPFLPLYLLEIGVPNSSVNLWSGLVFSATFFVGALMAPYWGRRADKSGKRLMVVRAGISLSIVYFLGALVRNPWELLIVRILQGFAAGFVPASMAIVASSVPSEKMGFSLGLMQTALLTGGILGPLLGGILAHLFGIRASFVLAATAIFIGTIAVRLLVAEPPKTKSPKTSGVLDDLRAAFKNTVLKEMLVLILITQMSAMVLQPLITLYIAELQGSLSGVVLTSGIIFSLAGIAGALAAPFWGKLGQKSGFMKIIVVSLIGAGIFNSLQFFASDIWQFGALQFIFGLFISGIFPAINANIVSNTDTNFQGRAFGLTMSANQLGGMIGPLLGSLASMLMGIHLIFVCTGLFLCIAGVGILISKQYKINHLKKE